MSPLIEDARRRQRKRRVALAAVVLVAAGLATALALLHRTSAPSERQARSTPRTVILLSPTGHVTVEPSTALRRLVLRIARRQSVSVKVDPATGAVMPVFIHAR